VKKREGNDVLETKIKIGKTQKETGRDYKFSKTHQTTKVKFYDYNPYEDVKNLLVEVPIEKLASNSYSLNYAEYMKDEAEEDEQYEDGVVVKTLGEVCKFLPKSKRNAKYGKDEGLYPFIKSSMIVKKYVDEPDYEEESLIIGDGGEPNINYGLKFSTSDHCYILQNKNKTILNLKYSYYYLFHNLDMMDKLYIGVAIKNISKSNISDIKIPIPPLEKQEEIVKYLDFIYEKANKTSQDKIKELKTLNEFCLNTQKMFGDNVVKTLGEVCEVNQGNTLTKNEMINGIYDVVGGGKIIGKHNKTNRCGNEFTLTRVGDININYINKPYYLTDNGFSIKSKIDNTITKYIYYLLLYNKDYLINLYQGTAQKVISKTNLKLIKIPIPSIERQKEIVDYCEYNDTLIQQLEKEIEHNKKQAQLFMTSIVKEISV
jgi:type I restriction enzyme S subunit